MKQINKHRKCPVCKNYTLITPIETGGGSSDMMRIKWDYLCTNCNAQFVEGK